MSLIRPLVQEATGKPWLSFSITDMSYTQWKNNYLTQVTTGKSPRRNDTTLSLICRIAQQSFVQSFLVLIFCT